MEKEIFFAKESEAKKETKEEEIKSLLLGVEKIYKKSGMDDRKIELFMAHNKQVLDFVREIAKAENFSEKEIEIAQLAAILHDCKKESPGVDFADHGSSSGIEASKILIKMKKRSELVENVVKAIERHMGNTGFVGNEARKKYGKDFLYEEPETRAEQSVYDADLLTILTEDGIKKILHIRENGQDFIKIDKQVALNQGITQKEAAILSVKESIENTMNSIKLESSKEIAEGLIDKSSDYLK